MAMQLLALVRAAVLVQKSAAVLALEQLPALAFAVLSAADEPDDRSSGGHRFCHS